MTMRPLWLIAALALTACGNYSNDDVEFLSAIPSRTELASKYTTSTAQAALREGVLAQAITAGEASTLAADTKSASDGFNSFLFELLDLLDAVVHQDPSTRSPNERTWGPY